MLKLIDYFIIMTMYTLAVITCFNIYHSVVQCMDSESLPNGHFTGNSTRHRSAALYECEEGYILIRAPVRTCGAAGQWSGTTPICASKQCIALQNTLYFDQV